MAEPVRAARHCVRPHLLDFLGHHADVPLPVVVLAFIAILVEAMALELADFLDVLLRPLVGERGELPSEAEQAAEQVLRVGVVLLPCTELILVVLVDETGVVDRRDLHPLCRHEIRAADLGAGQERRNLVDRLVALGIELVQILRSLLVLQVELRLLGVEALIGKRIVAARGGVLVLVLLLQRVVAELGTRQSLGELLVLGCIAGFELRLVLAERLLLGGVRELGGLQGIVEQLLLGGIRELAGRKGLVVLLLLGGIAGLELRLILAERLPLGGVGHLHVVRVLRILLRLS